MSVLDLTLFMFFFSVLMFPPREDHSIWHELYTVARTAERWTDRLARWTYGRAREWEKRAAYLREPD